MSQSITLWGATFNDSAGVDLPKTGGGKARFMDCSPTTAVESDVASGKIFFKSDGSQATGTASGGSGMNVQANSSLEYSRTTSYSSTGLSVTCNKAGTYKISWSGWRSSSSGTSGTELYINGSVRGSAYTSFTSTYGQHVEVSNVSLSANDTVEVYARARNTSSYMYVCNLIIQQTA